MACNSCNPCNSCPGTNPCPTKCKSQITSADLGELIYLIGLDVNLCKKYSPIIDVLGLTDCNGDPITSATPIVTCTDFQETLCEILSTLTSGVPIASGTVLIGADCQRHVMPAFQAPLTVLDTTTIDLTLAGTVLSGVVRVSDDAGNIIEIRVDGIYANVCTGISELATGTPIAAGTLLVGLDCQVHAMPAFQAPITISDTSCLNLTLTAGGVLSGVPVISPNADNVLSCEANGLYVPETVVPPETPITVIDSSSVNLTANGVNNHTLTAVVNISADTGNSAVIEPDGLFVPSVCEQFSDIGGIVNPAQVGDIFITRDCIPRTLPSNGGIAVSDTVTIDLTLSGAGLLSGDVEVSSVPDNILEVRPDGLAVRCTAVVGCVPDTTITAVDTSCLNLTVNESPNNVFTITGNPIVSPLVGNQLSCVATGLYVPPLSEITCEQIQNVFVENAGVIAPGQRVLSDNCQSYLSPTYLPIDSTSVNMTIGSVGGNPSFLAEAIIAPNAVGFPLGCNGISITPTGLSVPPETSGNQAAIFNISNLYSGVIVEGQIVVSSNFTVNISNPSDCRSAVLVLQIYVPQVATGSLAPGVSLTQVTLYESYNLPSILVTPYVQRSQQQLTDNDTTAVVARPGADSWEGVISTQFVVPPSFVGSYSVNAVLTQVAGSCTVFMPNPGLSYFLFNI